MKWGDSTRDSEIALAVWPNYRPRFGNWLMQELVEQGDKAPIWRDRRVPTEDGRVRGDLYPDREAAASAAATLNQAFREALAARDMEAAKKHSLQLKVEKSLQSKQRLHDEEGLMLADARRRHANDPRPVSSEIVLPAESEPFRQELSEHAAGIVQFSTSRTTICGPSLMRRVNDPRPSQCGHALPMGLALALMPIGGRPKPRFAKSCCRGPISCSSSRACKECWPRR